jgi:hypothetical protein
MCLFVVRSEAVCELEIFIHKLREVMRMSVSCQIRHSRLASACISLSCCRTLTCSNVHLEKPS